jgi:nucleoside-diphosphate-sugar epimerase
MLLIERAARAIGSPDRRLVVLFGHGLIGRCIVAALARTGAPERVRFRFSWDESNAWTGELDAVGRNVLSRNQSPAISCVDTIWSAGRIGFGASDSEVSAELAAFDPALAFAARLQDALPRAHHAFHLVSSAGGLYNGQRTVDASTRPLPTNPYGRAKVEQEMRLHRILPHARRLIYRPSSVYGFSGFGTRVGLITALIQNAMLHRTSRIYGSLQTVRDYVLNADVGDFIADQVAGPDKPSETFILASGKPSGIFEILQKVGRVIGIRPYCNFENVRSNADDMSFARSVLPPSFRPTDLETGIRQTARQLMAAHVVPKHPGRIEPCSTA